MTLPDLHRQMWDALCLGASPTRSPFTIWQLATCGLDGAPQLRSIVLREAEPALHRLSFHTDLRSPKLAQLRADGRVALLALDLDRYLQLRLSGVAQEVSDRARVQRVWSAARPHTLILYRTPHAPGTVIGSPEQGQVVQDDAQPGLQGDGFEHFALIDVTLQSMEYLDLTPGQHRRALFRNEAGNWQGQWIAP